MGMLKSYLKLVLLFHKERQFRGSVCVLGNQEIWATYEDLQGCFDEMGVSYRVPREIRGHSSRMFAADPVLRGLAARFVHASVFFDMLGMDEYVDVDKFETDRPVLQLDLNEPVSDTLRGRFDLVIDGGTAEHIFDVRSVFRNIVRMTKIGGHAMHISTFQPDHGFYAFSPCLFFDFYLANGFVDPECYILIVDYARILKTYGSTHPYCRYEYGRTTLPPLDDRPFLVFFVARKAAETSEIVVPTQGVFARSERTETLVSGSLPPDARARIERLIPGPLQGPARFVRPLVQRSRRLAHGLFGRRVALRALPRI